MTLKDITSHGICFFTVWNKKVCKMKVHDCCMFALLYVYLFSNLVIKCKNVTFLLSNDLCILSILKGQ